MNNNKIINIMRNIAGVLFAVIGLCVIIGGSFATGIFIILAGITLLPVFYDKTKLNRFKYVPIVLPLVLIIISIMFIPQSESNDNIIETDKTPISQEDKKVEIDRLHFDESELELDIKETKNISLLVSPKNADTEGLEYCSSDNKIAILEKTDITDDENSITLKVKPSSEGTCEIFVKSSNGIESNKVAIKIIDNEKKQIDEQAKKEAEGTANQEANQKEKAQANSPTTQENNSNNNNSKVVYRTPKGKRYHYNPDCGGKNSTQTTLDQAKAEGLTPCQKCVH